MRFDVPVTARGRRGRGPATKKQAQAQAARRAETDRPNLEVVVIEHDPELVALVRAARLRRAA